MENIKRSHKITKIFLKLSPHFYENFGIKIEQFGQGMSLQMNFQGKLNFGPIKRSHEENVA